MAKKHYQTTFSVPASFNEAQRATVARMIMDKIRENSARGIDRYGSPFPKYSKEYKKSLDFEIAGKSTLVNLELTGDMLVSMELISSSTGSVTIGYRSTSDLAGQVEGNQIGSYGSPNPNPSKARPFLGLPQSQLDLIIETVRNETEEDVMTRGFSDMIIKGLLGRFQ